MRALGDFDQTRKLTRRPRGRIGLSWLAILATLPAFAFIAALLSPAARDVRFERFPVLWWSLSAAGATLVLTAPSIAVVLRWLLRRVEFSLRQLRPGEQISALLGSRVMEVDALVGSINEMAEEFSETNDRLNHEAFHDRWTGLPNRTSFSTRLEASLRAVEQAGTVAVLFIDLDRFKTVNYTLGHQVGDALLGVVSQRMRAVVDTRWMAGAPWWGRVHYPRGGSACGSERRAYRSLSH